MTWYQDESLWETFYDCMFDEASFTLAKQQSPQILEMVGHTVHNMLDLACGPGRHLLGFAQFGINVTGVDLSGYLLSQAANHFDQHKELHETTGTLVHCDMLAYEPKQKFDLITNLFTSFGYYPTAEENQQLLNNAYQWLNKGGSLVIDTFGKEQVAHMMEPVHLTEYDNGDLRIERPMLIDDMSVFANEWILVRGDEVFRREYQHFVYSAIEMKAMLKQAGFEDIRIYGSFEGDDYDLESERLIAVAQK